MHQKIILLLLACCLHIGCSTTWNTSDPLRYSFDDIWDTTYQVLSKRYDILRAQRKDGEIETNWQYQRSNFYLKGYRHKVYAKVEPYVEKDRNKVAEPGDKVQPEEKVYVVKLRAPQEQNRNADNPEATAGATWLPAGSNAEQESLLLGFIKSALASKQQPKSDDTIPEPTEELPESWEP